MGIDFSTFIQKNIGALNPLTDAVFTKYTTATTFNTSTGNRSRTPVPYDCQVNLGQATNKFWNGLAQAGDLHVNLAKLNTSGVAILFEPLPGDKITIGTTSYKVIECIPSYTGSEAVLYTMLVHK